MAVAFPLILLIIRDSLAEWVHVASTMRKGDATGNASATRFTVPGSFDYSDQFSCRVHNLTMMGYAKNGGDSPFADDDIPEMNYLEKLETKLHDQIDERIRSLGRGRVSRTYHIGFPSLEGALVSISLLLFAVYLIKLVMKLVHTFSFKRGTTEYVGFLSNIRQPIVISPNRQKRSFDFDVEALKLQALLEDQDRLFRQFPRANGGRYGSN